MYNYYIVIYNYSAYMIFFLTICTYVNYSRERIKSAQNAKIFRRKYHCFIWFCIFRNILHDCSPSLFNSLSKFYLSECKNRDTTRKIVLGVRGSLDYFLNQCVWSHGRASDMQTTARYCRIKRDSCTEMCCALYVEHVHSII